MSKSNPILPSEPLSLQPDLIAAAVLAGEADDDYEDSGSRQLSPRSASKVRRRMDIRSHGRSESRSRDEDYEYGDEPSSYAERQDSPQAHRQRGERSSSAHEHNGGRWNHDRGEGRSHSPSHADRRREPYGGSADYGRSPNNGTRESYRGRDGARDAEPSHDSNNPYQRGGVEDKGDPTPSRVLGIFGMSKFTSEEALQELFGRYGPVEKIQLIRDPHEGRSRGFGFINMENVADAQKARDALSGSMIHDRKVRVDFSVTNRAHSPTPGKYKGQDTAQLASRRRGGDRQPDRDSRRYGDTRYGDTRQGDTRYGDTRRYGSGAPPPSSYRDNRGGAPYHPRRRPNSRDRRHRDHAHSGGQRSRSRSPGYHAGAQRPPSGYDSYRRPAHYADGGRPREYDGRRSNGYAGSRSPQRSYGHERGGYAYENRAGEGRDRPARNDYHSRESPGAKY